MTQLIAIASSTEILFLILIVLGCIMLSLLFIRSIIRERRRIAEQKEKEGTLSTEEFFDLLGKLLDASKKITLVLLRIDIFDSVALFKSVGEMQYNTAFDQLISRIYQVLGLNIKVARQDDDLVYVYMRTTKIGNANLDNLCRTLITELNKSILIAGMLKVDFDLNVGVVTYPGGGKTVDAIQQNLQLAVVAAKRKGINQYAFYDISLTNQESDEYKSFLEIKSAIDNKDFTLYYQPIVNLETLEVASAESLLRWKHKDRGILPPSSFLSVMEHTGDINWVGFWALENLFKQHASWVTQYPDINFFLSTNLSDKQLLNPQLAEEVRRLAKKFKISPINFCFEVLQSCFESATPDSMIINNVKALKNMGFLITIDNFGVSDTSLNSIISNVKVDMIKLSRGYINQSQNSEFIYDMIKMLVGYAKKNEIKMVAEGVETAENLDYIKKLGIEYGQGFFFAKPGAPSDLMNAVVMTPWTTSVITKPVSQTIIVEPDATSSTEEKNTETAEAVVLEESPTANDNIAEQTPQENQES